MAEEAAEVPTPWVAIVVERGEKNKHLYMGMDGTHPSFHKTEKEAYEWAYEHCRMRPLEEVLILRASKLVRVQPMTFELITPA